MSLVEFLRRLLRFCDYIVTLVGQSRLRWYGRMTRKDMTYGRNLEDVER
jgi:hypothetical protein